MALKKLSLEEALELESESLITLYDFTPDTDDTSYHPGAQRWVDNYHDMLFRFRQFTPSQVSSMLNCDFRVELELPYEQETNTYSWRYIYGKVTEDLKKFNQYHSKGKFVYVLTNKVHNFVKIGKAVNPQRRLEQINNAGVASEWKLAYALPVENDYMVENSVHKHLAEYRRGTDQGSSREFFEVTLQQAIDTIEMLAKEFKTGEPTYY